MFAFIAADGTINTGSRVTDADYTGAGTFTITFDRDLTACVPSVTAFNYGTFAHASISGKQVTVHLFQEGGDPIQSGFFIAVTC